MSNRITSILVADILESCDKFNKDNTYMSFKLEKNLLKEYYK